MKQMIAEYQAEFDALGERHALPMEIRDFITKLLYAALQYENSLDFYRKANSMNHSEAKIDPMAGLE